jgi:hypothetical protein
MTRAAALVVGVWLAWPAGVGAHRLDEYLQATQISLAPDVVELELDLTPGAQIAEPVIQLIDRDRDGTLSDVERAEYSRLVIAATSLEIDGRPVVAVLASYQFPSTDDLRAGTGTIRLNARAQAAGIMSGSHELRYRNRHQPAASAYLVNAMMPPASVRIRQQRRDPDQRQFTLTFDGPSLASWNRWPVFVSGLGLLGLLWRIRHRA